MDYKSKLLNIIFFTNVIEIDEMDSIELEYEQ